MRSPALQLRVIGLPLFALGLELALVSQQWARRNQYARELKETQAEYVRVSRNLSAVPTSASALFAGSYAHAHSASEAEAPHTDAAPLPATPATSAEETRLFLTPGGVYTQADIDANGKVSATQKFAGLVAKHDMHPKAGQRLCPITNTRADSRFAWIIGGQSYTFCCPPCVGEFVSKAKRQTQALPPPDSYIQH